MSGYPLHTSIQDHAVLLDDAHPFLGHCDARLTPKNVRADRAAVLTQVFLRVGVE